MKNAFYAFTAALVISLATACSAEDEIKPWERHLSEEAIRSDFTALYQGLKSGHINLFANKSKPEYDALFKRTYDSFTQPQSLLSVQVAFQKFTAFGNVAHANISFPQEAYKDFRENGGKSFPLFLTILDGRTYVSENYSANERINLGDEILSMNGVPMNVWLSRLSDHVSADSPRLAHTLLEFLFAHYLWLEIGEVDNFSVVVKAPSLNEHTLTMRASTQDEQRAVAASRSSGESDDAQLRKAKMLGDNIAYLKPGPFYNAEEPENLWDNSAFSVFIDEAFETFMAKEADRLIIDLRENPGGDNSFSDLMLAWFADRKFRFCSSFNIRSSDEAAASNQARINEHQDTTTGVSQKFAKEYERTPRGETFEFDIDYVQPRSVRFEGDVYVIVNRHSYSNTVTVAAMVQDYNFGTLVGEKTADLATTFGAMETFNLPNTKLKVGFPKAHIIRPSGERKPDGVTPDWVIQSPIVAQKTDVVLDKLLDKLAR